MKIFQITLFTILFCFTTSCQQQKVDHRPTISVSIAPLAFLTEQIVDSDFVINTLVPSGANVETYEPTQTQMRQVAQSQFYISTGLRATAKQFYTTQYAQCAKHKCFERY